MISFRIGVYELSALQFKRYFKDKYTCKDLIVIIFVEQFRYKRYFSRDILPHLVFEMF